MTWPHRVVPVVAVPSVPAGVGLAKALVAGGLPVVEVTLRSDCALDAIAAIRAEVPEIRCGAGTLLTPADAKAAVDAGAQFLVSPGTTDALLDALLATGLPALPGAATASEAMRLHERGVRLAKMFPGDLALVRALAGPLPDLLWCCTGGITEAGAPAYLALPTVAAVGGSWMAPGALVEQGSWPEITRLAQAAAAL